MASRRVVLVEYFCTDALTLVFGARCDWTEPQVTEIRRPLDELRHDIVRRFGPRAAWRGPTAASSTRRGAFVADDWQTFAAPFLDPIREWAAEGDLLWLVPHDVLHYVPFHALMLDRRPLVARHPVVYTPSASALKYCQAKRTHRPRRHAVVFGDSAADLPFARVEAAMVAERFASSPLLGAEATKSALASQLRERAPVDVLHLACHGYFNIDEPLASGIRLAADDGAAARLTVEEIFALELNADLVVMSACDSGMSDRQPGDELIGLTRALIYAGTPSVLVSLWPVDDLSTLLLMERFYDGLAGNLNKAEALQQAQCQMITLEETAVHAFVHARSQILERGGDVASARRLRQLAFDSLLEAEDITPRPAGGQPWHPYSSPVWWAPFVLVGDWQ